MRVLTSAEYEPPKKEVFRAKILIDGIEYVKANLLKDGSKQNESGQHVRVEIKGPIQNIVGSTINAPVTQSRDDFSRSKTPIKTINSPIEADKIQKPKIWTASNIMFVILTGVIIGLLVLIFWEKIRQFFE